jgi:hypothetical protein
MKALTILLCTDTFNDKEAQKKLRTGKLLKLLFAILMLSWITLLSSCLVGPPRHGGPPGYHENHENHGNNGHHDDHGNHDRDDSDHK